MTNDLRCTFAFLLCLYLAGNFILSRADDDINTTVAEINCLVTKFNGLVMSLSLLKPVPPNPWVVTPCIRSTALSHAAGCNVFLKLETLQPSNSFKSRGVGNFMLKALESHKSAEPHFYISSGGNAGLACATAALSLDCKATIVVPTSTNELMIKKLKARNAEVIQVGAHWSEADTFLRELLVARKEMGEEGVYVPPFDHEDIWEGNRSLVEELEPQMSKFKGYNALVCSVGGGGLFSGIMAGLESAGRLEGGSEKTVKVLAMETLGADSLSQAVEKGELIRLPAITSIATSLGATQVCKKAFEWGLRKEVTSCVLSDAEAAMGCLMFADDERILVEAACGVNVATAYNGRLRELFADLSDEKFSKLNVVIVVCGGSNINLQMLEAYRLKYAKDEEVLRKFHKSTLEEPKKVATELAKENIVPEIMHDRELHEEVTNPECVENAQAIPAIGQLDEKEVEKQIEEHGKIVDVEKRA